MGGQIQGEGTERRCWTSWAACRRSAWRSGAWVGRSSAERAEQTQQDATLKALTTLRKQATEEARALGMEVDRFQSVSLDNAPGVTTMARAETGGAAPMLAPMPPPNATPESQNVIASVSADVVLTLPARAP